MDGEEEHTAGWFELEDFGGFGAVGSAVDRYPLAVEGLGESAGVRAVARDGGDRPKGLTFCGGSRARPVSAIEVVGTSKKANGSLDFFAG
ncbi:hypothetical protein [Streptomyces sp. NPDC002540]